MSRRVRYVALRGDTYQPAPVRPSLVGQLLLLLLGGLAGLALAGVMFAWPDRVGALWQAAQAPFEALDAGQQTWVLSAAFVVAVVLLAVWRAQLIRSAALLGLILGMAVWVPFGRHILAGVPQIAQEVPTLPAGLDAFVAGDPLWQTVRDWGERTLPLPAGLVAGRAVGDTPTHDAASGGARNED